MQNSQYRLTLNSVAFREHLQERHCMWLPVTLPVPSEPVPTDVALWLFELRHYSDSYEVPCSLKVNVECGNVADNDYELGTEGLKELGLLGEGEEILNCHCEVQEYLGAVGNSTSVDDIPELQNQKEDYVKCYSKGEETLNCHSELQEHPENSTSGEDIPELLILKEDCVESHSKEKETPNCCWELQECSESYILKENIPVLQQKEGDGAESHKCDYDDESSLQIYNYVAQKNGIVNTDDSKAQRDNQNVTPGWKSIYQVCESPSCIQPQKSNGILWEANPLYGRVGVETSEGGFRKLCHITLEELGNSICVDPGDESEHISEPVFGNDIEKTICECGVGCVLKTECSEGEKERYSGNFPLKSHNKSCSFREKACMETCQCSVDLIDNSVNQTTSSAENKTDTEVFGQDSVCSLELCQAVGCVHDKSATNDSECEIIEDCYPTLQFQHSAAECLGDSYEVTVSCDEKCEEVLHNLELIIQSLEVGTGDILSDHEMEPDCDFLKLCQEAENLAEEAVQQCTVQITTKRKEARSITLSSDLSDDVFVNSPSSEEHNVIHPVPQEARRHHSLDINSIFDDGKNPPVPPVRTKRNKERSKTIQITECKTVDESKGSVTAPECDTGGESVSQSDETNPSIREIDNENCLLECQELLMMKRVTESTKEKRNAKVASRYEDRNSCCQGEQTDQRVPDCDSMNVTIVVSDCFNVSVGGEHSESFVPDVNGDECSDYPNIVLTQIRPISSAEFPPVEQREHNVSSSCEDRLQSEAESVEASCDESGTFLQSRKGSTSSDITAWKQELQHSGLCYLDDEWDADCMLQPDKWFSSNDSEGRVYFFEENSSESSWTLPDISNAGCDNPAHSAKPNPSESGKEAKKETKDKQQLEVGVQLRSDQQNCKPESRAQHRMTKAHSMVLANSSRKKQTSSKSSSIPRDWPQLWDGDMCVLKEGTLNRTKITENGKKLRKNWAPAHVVLTELFLLFFKDAKTFEAMKSSRGESSSGAAQPELSIDLNGAMLEHGEKASSRRYVFLLTTVLGLQVLLQCDNAQQEEDWYRAIHKTIIDLPSAYNVSPRNKATKLTPPHLSSNSPEETKKSSHIGRSKSVKMKFTPKDGSQEDLTANSEENQTKIRNRLKKFFHRRPTKEVLVKKGIYKDEPVFGCHLPDVCKGESPQVPLFVQRCIEAIECKEENMKTDGLYRASGNLSQVQKIRLQVDQNKLETLEQEEDVHVLTGALKLFFRELKKPLIPFEHFSKALRASTNPDKKEKLQQFREIVKALPLPNRDTLEFLLTHLLRVTKYQEFNRMHIPNLAIVFGPTLMWPEAESLNMALDLMQQNLVIECFLQEFKSIFHH